MSTRMKDVAEHAGVSVTTISHVINKTRYVSPSTRKRVQQAIRELRFYKDAHAERLRSGRSNFFGIIVSDITNPFFPELIRGFESAALDRGFDTLLGNTNYVPRRTQACVRMMIENKVRGVAVMTSEFAPHLIEDFTINHVAVVFLGLGAAGRYTANIRVSYTPGISQAIEHLHTLGHKEIAYISGPQTLRSARDRRDAFVRALRLYDLPSDWIVEGNHKEDGGMAAARTLLARGKAPTAILCGNDLTAVGAMRALQEAGLEIPTDVSVVGFDDIYFASLCSPPLTTISLPRKRMGELAFEALQDILRTKKRLGREYPVKTELVVRRSTARSSR